MSLERTEAREKHLMMELKKKESQEDEYMTVAVSHYKTFIPRPVPFQPL
jgi:hypothetical protein